MWECVAPFGAPVEPDVNTAYIEFSGDTAGFGKDCSVSGNSQGFQSVPMMTDRGASSRAKSAFHSDDITNSAFASRHIPCNR
ncbi:hypothetical protein RRF57_000690 [Xylaria bambusicola]|uniref:Uncharacterized protein n=1 Tax=Xylaria bambusicola TaxID=326684 RepID=A0AAN7UF11_9PEZI